MTTALDWVAQAAEGVREAESELLGAMMNARDAGKSLRAIAKAAGSTRMTVSRMLAKAQQ